MHFGYRNKNGRIYDESNININEISNALYGEIGLQDSHQISLSNVSHITTNLEIINGILYGQVEILSTPQGNILKNLINESTVIFRPRGTGEVNSDGTISDYKLISFDAIIDHEDSFDKTILRKEKIEKIMKRINEKKY